MEEDDHWVVVPVQDAELVAQAIIDKANEIKRGDRPPSPQARETKPAPLALPAPCNKRPPPAGPGLPLSGTHKGATMAETLRLIVSPDDRAGHVHRPP